MRELPHRDAFWRASLLCASAVALRELIEPVGINGEDVVGDRVGGLLDDLRRDFQVTPRVLPLNQAKRFGDQAAGNVRNRLRVRMRSSGGLPLHHPADDLAE